MTPPLVSAPAQQSNNQTIKKTVDEGTPSAADVSVSAPADDDLVLPDLTDEQIAFLRSERYERSATELTDSFALTEDDFVFLNEMDRAVLGGLIDLSKYIVALRNEFPGLNAEERDRLIGTLLAYRFVPFDGDLRPSAEEAAHMAGIVIPKMPYYRVYTKPMTYSGAAHEVALIAGVSLSGQVQERLRDIFISRLKGVRSDQQTVDQLVRSSDVGGLNVNETVAHAVIAAMDDVATRARLMTEDEYARWLNASIHPSTPPETTAERAASSPLEAEEEKEISEIIARMPAGEEDRATALAGALRTVLERLSWHPEDSYLQRRLTNMISTRLRDVRSRNEFFMKLMRDPKVGGLGIDRKAAERLTEDVERGYAEFRERIAAEEKAKLNAQMAEQEKKIEERKRHEAEERQRWFQEKIAAKHRTEDEQKNVLERIRSVREIHPEHPVEAKDRAREAAAFGELVPSKVRVVGETSPMKILAPGVSEVKSKATESAPAVSGRAVVPEAPGVLPPEGRRVIPPPPVVKVSRETAKLQEANEGRRPKIEDVKTVPMEGAARHLAGPVQEIGEMTLEQFRRLAKRPEDAVKRITDLVKLLEEESFEKRVAGIRAWQGSPLQMLYVKLVAEAFRSGKPVKALLEERRGSGEALTNEELEAIVKLNGMLRL